MVATRPPIVPNSDDEHGLSAAKDKLMGETGRPFDIDKVLAQNRVHREREEVIRKQAKESLERDVIAARLRGNQKRIHELEKQQLDHAREQSHNLEIARRALEIEKARHAVETQHKAIEKER